MNRSAEQRVADILEAIARCRRYVDLIGRVDAAELIDMAEDAIERNLQIIGEATNHLPAVITAAHPEIAWPQIRGFRNILVHQYFGVDIEVVRDVVETHLPPLAEVLEQHRGQPAPDSGP